ncbi:hypothetical protein E2C01_053221 [Portunus trituberculatus]|uniref:Uncharacterized protein n=1 Tax=Portunus trituberculatus TaxID=210409 RepID=A0A5B7GNW8_PORTR|nr:hypothetical protein [Portunus trituberculatus]
MRAGNHTAAASWEPSGGRHINPASQDVTFTNGESSVAHLVVNVTSPVLAGTRILSGREHKHTTRSAFTQQLFLSALHSEPPCRLAVKNG